MRNRRGLDTVCASVYVLMSISRESVGGGHICVSACAGVCVRVSVYVCVCVLHSAMGIAMLVGVHARV